MFQTFSYKINNAMNRIAIIISFFIIFINQAVSQDIDKGFKALEKQNYKRAAGFFSEILTQKADDIAANYGMAVVHAAETGEQYDLYKAYELISIAADYYSRLDEAKKAETNNYFTAEQLQNKKNEIDDKLFNNATSTNKLADIIKFNEQCPDSRNYEKALAQRHKLEFWDTKSRNTESAYNEFIAMFPNATEVAEAKKMRNALAFQTTKQEGTLVGYQQFIKRYPNAEQIEEAKQKIYELEFKKVSVLNTAKAYKQFLENYPEATQATQAKQYVYMYEYKAVEQNNTIESCDDYIKTYPQSPHVSKVTAMRSKLIQNSIDQCNTTDELDAFLIKYKNTDIYQQIFDKKTKIAGETLVTENKYTENNPTWQKAFDFQNLKERATDALITDNCIVLCGITNTTDKWHNDGWIIKCTPEGNLIWETRFGDELDDVFNCVDIMPNNNIIAAGHTNSRGALSGEAIVVIYDENGKITLKKTFKGTDALDVCATKDGAFVVGGYTAIADGNRDMWLKKFGEKGNVIWEKYFPAKGIINSVKVNNQNQIVVAGNEQIMKFSANGDLLWEKNMIEDVKIAKLTLNENDNILVVGRNYSFKKETRSDFWVAEIMHVSGEIKWEKSFNRNNEFDNGFSIESAKDGIFVAGLTSNNKDTDDDLWLLHLDKTGNILNEKLFGTNKNEKRPTVMCSPSGQMIVFTAIGLDSDFVLLGF